ncbi:MAG: hypothetical protein JXB32_19450 [Deltaproteobacteria bacterium]|nr:hypothetical protein [Deltaproteobacteria bacterium]
MKASRLLAGLALAGLVASIGCFDRDLTDIRPGTTTGVTIRVEQIGIVEVDIVVLVDNSGSMAQEQAQLAARFRDLINELVNPTIDSVTGRPEHPPVEDLNIGVISSDMGTMDHVVSTCSNSSIGDNGCFRSTSSVSGCSSSYPTFLSRNEDNAGTYTPDQMATDFACIAELGTRGCGFEQQLKAMRQATTTNVVAGGCNAGFLRTSSLIALIFVTDEEDCSVRPDHREMFDQDRTDLGHLNIRCFAHPEFVEPWEEYVTAFRSLRPAEEQEKIVLGMIIGVPPDAPQCIGPGDELTGCLAVPAMAEMVDPATPSQLVPSCNTSMGLAFPPRRFIQVAQAFGDSAYVDSICKPEWNDAISGITDKLVERLPSTCFPRALTFDQTTCDADCQVIETLNDTRDCPFDPSCPDCPPATLDEIHNLASCTNGGVPCEPLKRNLGTILYSDGTERRLCLIRQANRTSDGTTCQPPTAGNEGWFYTPEAQSEEHCPQVTFSIGSTGSLVDNGSTAELRCLSELCPADRVCGSACCRDTEICSGDVCVPAT